MTGECVHERAAQQAQNERRSNDKDGSQHDQDLPIASLSITDACPREQVRGHFSQSASQRLYTSQTRDNNTGVKGGAVRLSQGAEQARRHWNAEQGKHSRKSGESRV